MFIWSLPNRDFFLSKPLEVFDQGSTAKCEAYAATSIGEDYFKMKFNPDYTHENALIVSGGKPPTMRDVCEAVKRFGLLPISGGDPSSYRAKSYSRVWGFMSAFDLIRGAMRKGYPVLCGIYWQQEWDKEDGGIVKSNYQNYKLFPHAIKAFGQKTINGKPMIMVLNSRGNTIGHNGLFYFSKENGLISPYIISF